MPRVVAHRTHSKRALKVAAAPIPTPPKHLRSGPKPVQWSRQETRAQKALVANLLEQGYVSLAYEQLRQQWPAVSHARTSALVARVRREFAEGLERAKLYSRAERVRRLE